MSGYIQGNPAYLLDPDQEDGSGGLRPGAMVAVLQDGRDGVERIGPFVVKEVGAVGAGGGERVKLSVPHGTVTVYRSEVEPW